MKKLLLPLLFIIASCGTNTKNNPNLNRDLGEPLLKNAVDIIAKNLYASYPQYDYHDYSMQYTVIDDALYLDVVMNKVGGKAKGKLYFKSFTDSTFVVEAKWGDGYYKLYSVIFHKSGTNWENKVTGFLLGIIVKEIDLDGNGTLELIIKSSTIDSKDGYCGGQYNLGYLNSKGEYETYYGIHMGNYKEYINNPEKNSIVELTYHNNNTTTTIESIVSNYNRQQLAKGFFNWDGEKLIQENTKNNQLTIEADEILVRDNPDTGEVIMKLNSGNKCTLLSKGKMSCIGGMFDYWYYIEFNGIKGWVFGSQTNLKYSSTQLKTGNQIWEFLLKTNKEGCNSIFEEEYFQEYPGGCEFIESNNSFSMVYGNEDGYDESKYTLWKIIEGEIMLIQKNYATAAASSCSKYNTLPIIFNDYWQLADGDNFEGDLDTVYQFPDNKILFVTHSKDNCMMDLFLKFDSKTKINLYLVDKQAKPMVSKIQELDKHQYNNDYLEDLADGTLFIDSVGINYFFELSPIRLKLSEFKRRKVGENYERVSDATIIEIYQWDNQQNKFILHE